LATGGWVNSSIPSMFNKPKEKLGSQEQKYG
jgi:hypothetical protein